MTTLMTLEELTSVGQRKNDLSGTKAVAFRVLSEKDECDWWIQKHHDLTLLSKLGRSNRNFNGQVLQSSIQPNFAFTITRH
jgi:hypothetical protein